MTKLGNLGSSPPLKTASEIRSIIGTPHEPCSVCGTPAFSITGRGEWICWGCDWERSQLPRGIVLRIVILSHTGKGVAYDRDELERMELRRDAFDALDISRFRFTGHEWVGWDAYGWGYAARTFGLPVGEIELWIQRTRGLRNKPDEVDFRRGSRIPEVDGLALAWWPRGESAK